ncbi:hypothetical protein LCGC14_1307950 [marine sediment metagenome]|uniref:Uncharacterized protein n=1 Tax=marine sediment metagenome TaxID=412755 RepID=A0A0F9L7Z8_9ZZZZ
MKYLKIKIPKQGTTLIYPPSYHSVKMEGGAGYIEEKATGDTYVLLWGEDATAKKLIGEPNVTEITKMQAMSFSDQNEDDVMEITDEAMTRLLQIKASLGQALTSKEKKAMDPENDSVKGFGKRKKLKDQINLNWSNSEFYGKSIHPSG